MGNTGAGIVFVCTLIACGALASAPGLEIFALVFLAASLLSGLAFVCGETDR